MSLSVTIINYQNITGNLDDYDVSGVDLGNLENKPSTTLAEGGQSLTKVSSEVLDSLLKTDVDIKVGYEFNNTKFIVKIMAHVQVIGIGKSVTWEYYDPNDSKWHSKDEDATPITITCGDLSCTMTPSLGHRSGDIEMTVSSTN